jgi:putative transposase
MSRELNNGKHSTYELKVHLVFLTKYRRKALSARVHIDLVSIFTSVCDSLGARLAECNGEEDHVHLLVAFTPQIPISKLVNILKGVSARLLKKKGYPEIDSNLWGKHLWSRSYYAGTCGGATLETIKAYIQGQDRPTSPA